MYRLTINFFQLIFITYYKFLPDYIRPICLPDGTPTIQDVGKEVYTSGWGGKKRLQNLK